MSPVIDDGPMTPVERDATGYYGDHLDREIQFASGEGELCKLCGGTGLVQDTPIREPRGAVRIVDAAGRAYSLERDRLHKHRASRRQSFFSGYANGRRDAVAESGIEFVDPSEIERVKGMPPLDKGEE